MKKLLLLALLIKLLAVHAIAQESIIRGKVVDKDHEPLVGVSVIVENDHSGAQTDTEGNFEIKGIKKRSVILLFSSIGYSVKKIPVQVSNTRVITIPDVVLFEEIKNLQEVVITNQRKNRFARTESDYVAKLPLRTLENPQVYNVVSAELLKEQSITNFDDALKNVPGMQKLWESTGRGSDGAGYYSMRGFFLQPNLVNGLPALTHGSPDPVNIEQIEAIKGPSGTLFGSSLISYGGLLNIVTKKPHSSFAGEVSYLSGSYGLNRLTADLNTPLDSAGRFLFRITSAYHSENSFQDAGFKKSFFVAPTLSVQATDKLSFLIVTEIMNPEQTNPTMLFLDRDTTLTVDHMDDLAYDPERSYTSNNLSIKNPTFSLQAQMNYQLSPSWRSQTAFSKSSTSSKGYYSYLYEATQYYDDYLTRGSVFNRYVSKQNATTDITDIQQNFIGDFKLGPIRNRMVIGADFMQMNYIDNSTGYVQNGIIYMGNDEAATVYDILYEGEEVTDYDSGILSQAGMDALLAGNAVDNIKMTEKVFGAYVSDVINFSPSLAVMASLRLDWFEGDPYNDDDDQTALSPKFGITYQPFLNKLTVFANYMNGFTNVPAQQVADADGTNVRIKTFDPEHANQYELGIKTNFWEDKLAATISYYKIKVSDKVMPDPDNINNSIQEGEVESNGFEIDVITNPFPGLNAVVGYSYNDSEIPVANSNVGTRPLEAGPENLFNFWASYKFQESSKLDGLGLGFGLNYAGESLAINYDKTGDFIFPAYTILNSVLFYDTDSYRIAVKIDNLADKEYYTGWSTINPQKPRTISASFSFRF
jgi:iron complex outermembrane receptor protein